jgi:hypothetical protein
MTKKIVKSPGRGSDQFLIRFPEGMRDRLSEIAAKNGRSMNAELIGLLKDGIAARANMSSLSNEFAEFKQAADLQLRQLLKRMELLERRQERES